MITLKIKIILSYMQCILLFIAYFIFKLFVKIDNSLFIIGVSEISKFLYSLKFIFYNSYVVKLNNNKYYDMQYDFELKYKNQFLGYCLKF